MELESIAPSPRCTASATNSVVGLVALAQAAALSACRCQPPHFPVLVDWFADPLGVRVSSDSFMEWINEDNLKKFLRRIFTHPVGIQDPHGPTVVASMLLRNRLQASSKLELVDTVVDRLAVGGTFRNWVFAAPAAHMDPVYDIALFGLVAQPVRLVGPSGARGAGRGAALRAGGTASSAPAAGSMSRPTASSPQLLDVLVGAHVGSP